MSSIMSILTCGAFYASNANNPKEEGRDLPKHRDVQ
jgi:hypothetical protein